ncbi:hypothetical protein PQO03_09595 [Lentisphaera profundi]|uniref:Glycosyl transferase n=1 Tax=Lentisphaera profundi TaxID=1658616 RepID=A0ABY7VT09_9BACT|nr:hypothetical protein [Lentisphaera profundi]WDE95966.1 hypothetical protein PQO03_09595 [Lentisphaera profundi]
MNFITLFDHNYLPQGVALYKSLEKYCKPDFKLYVLCMNDLVYEQLLKFELENLVLLRLLDYETPELLEAKKDRTIGEYCWTLSSHTFAFAKRHTPSLKEITYLDTDIFFFDHPEKLIQELDDHNKSVLITEHAFGPGYEHSIANGRFCIQFLTVRYNDESAKVIKKWQDQCTEWCYFRNEEGKFGDQKYLDEWPTLYPDTVYILEQKNNALAPWNVENYLKKNEKPVFYHFHNFRFIESHKARCYHNYKISKKNQWIYREYKKVLQDIFVEMDSLKMVRPFFPRDKQTFQSLRDWKHVYLSKNTLFQTYS